MDSSAGKVSFFALEFSTNKAFLLHSSHKKSIGILYGGVGFFTDIFIRHQISKYFDTHSLIRFLFQPAWSEAPDSIACLFSRQNCHYLLLVSEQCDKVSHKNLPGHIYYTKTHLTKERNKVLFQHQYGVNIINRNAASVTFKCRFRIDSTEAYNSF